MFEWFRHTFDRMVFEIRFLIGVHLLNPLWHSRDNRRVKRYLTTKDSVLKYLRRYRRPIEGFIPGLPTTDAEPERAFTIWLQGEESAPELVKACFRSMRKFLNVELVILDENTISDWITLPPYIIKKWKAGKIRLAHFTDICRVELLYQHGGIWLDSTDFMTAPVPEQIMNADFFVYLAGRHYGGWYAFMQNCFIRARKHNPLLGVWREVIFKYWEKENNIICYYAHQLMFQFAVENNKTARLLFNEMPKVEQDPTHALWIDHYLEPFDEDKYKKLTDGAFFQKTSYKSKELDNVPPGSFADMIIKS